MRFMVIVKANKDSEAGAMPTEELLTEMGKFNEELAKAGMLLAAEGLHPSSKGARVRFSGGKTMVIDGAVEVQVERGGDRVAQAGPLRGYRGRDSPGVRGGRFRRRVHSRAKGAGGASACADGCEDELKGRDEKARQSDKLQLVDFSRKYDKLKFVEQYKPKECNSAIESISLFQRPMPGCVQVL